MIHSVILQTLRTPFVISRHAAGAAYCAELVAGFVGVKLLGQIVDAVFKQRLRKLFALLATPVNISELVHI